MKPTNQNFTIENITIRLPEGFIMGLIGPNGSDKTDWCFRQQLYNSGVFTGRQ